jgi:hypothetical protein
MLRVIPEMRCPSTLITRQGSTNDDGITLKTSENIRGLHLLETKKYPPYWLSSKEGTYHFGKEFLLKKFILFEITDCVVKVNSKFLGVITVGMNSID